MSWPDGGAWVVAPTSSGASWALATAALCAASTARTAVLRIVDDSPGDDPDGSPGGSPDDISDGSPDDRRTLLRDSLVSHVEVRAGAASPVGVDDLVGLVGALSRTHGLVLVTGAPGLAVPLGRAGWTLADLAWALGAPVVLVADLGPDAANHTTLALDVLAGRDLAGTIVAVGDGDEPAGLPVGLAGRIPADAADRPGEFRAAAPGWLDPLLHATRRPTATTAAAPPGAAPPTTPGSDPAEPSNDPAEPPGRRLVRAPARRTVSGKRVLIVLLVVFLGSVLLLCGLNVVAPTNPATVTRYRIGTTQVAPDDTRPSARLPVPVTTWPTARPPVPLRTPTPSRSPSVAACAHPTGKVVPTVPDAATRARVDAAWLRIERWLARHAPRSRAGLRPPAAPARIAALQTRMSVPFPADLVASLRRHDGADDFDLPPFYQPMRLDQIAADMAVNCRVRADAPVDEDWWHPSFVPFASAGDGGSLLVDQRPGGHGRVGEFYPEDGTGFDGWPASVAELLNGVARSLETGEPYAGRYGPTVDAEGRLDWTIE